MASLDQGLLSDVAQSTLDRAREQLISQQSPQGWWKGELETNVTMDAEDLMLREFLGVRTDQATEESARWIRSHQRDDGSWVWRYARFRTEPSGTAVHPDFGDLWEAVSALTMPILLVRGLAWSVVDDDDVAELLRRQPTATVIGVDGAGHSIQGDRPLELAGLLSDFLFPDG